MNAAHTQRINGPAYPLPTHDVLTQVHTHTNTNPRAHGLGRSRPLYSVDVFKTFCLRLRRPSFNPSFRLPLPPTADRPDMRWEGGGKAEVGQLDFHVSPPPVEEIKRISRQATRHAA